MKSLLQRKSAALTLILFLLSLVLLPVLFCGCNYDIIVPSGTVVEKRYAEAIVADYGIVKILDPRRVSGYRIKVMNDEGDSQWFYVSEEHYNLISVGDRFVYNSAIYIPV
ncbi:MAG: hypothetical protein ACI4MT_02760 [Christensenellales bacterium]